MELFFDRFLAGREVLDILMANRTTSLDVNEGFALAEKVLGFCLASIFEINQGFPKARINAEEDQKTRQKAF